MASRYRSEVRGARKLRRTLERIEPALTSELKEEFLEAARDVQKATVPLIPVDQGHLKEAFSSPRAVGRTGRGFKTVFGLRTKRLKRIAAHAHLVNDGTKGYDGIAPNPKRNKKGLKKRKPYHLKVPPMRAVKFLDRGLDSSRNGIRRRLDRATDRALKFAVGTRGFV